MEQLRLFGHHELQQRLASEIEAVLWVRRVRSWRRM